MIYSEENTQTWMELLPGDECRHCRTKITRGHRYYEEPNGSVIHYCCVRYEREQKEKAA